jgi:hypothetical protein
VCDISKWWRLVVKQQQQQQKQKQEEEEYLYWAVSHQGAAVMGSVFWSAMGSVAGVSSSMLYR